MSCRRFPIVVSAALLTGAIVFAASAFAADKPAAKMDEHAEHAGMDMQMPKAGPEQAYCQRAVGKWNATTKMMMAPGAEPMVMQGTEDVTSICNGLFIAVAYKGTDPQMPFEGYGLEGYDSVKKMYTGTWCDSWSTGMMTYEGTVDAKGVYNGTGMMADPKTGTISSCAMQGMMPDANTRVFKMWQGTDKSGPPTMEITYTRVMEGTQSAHK